MLVQLKARKKDVSSLKVPSLRDGLELKDYQKVGAAALFYSPHLVLWDQVGLGKSVTSFSAYVLKKALNPDLKLVYTTVSSGLLQAEEEFHKFFKDFKTCSITSSHLFEYSEGECKKTRRFKSKQDRKDWWEHSDFDCYFVGHTLFKLDSPYIGYYLRPYALVLDEANYFKGVNPIVGKSILEKQRTNKRLSKTEQENFCSIAHKRAKQLARKAEATWLLTADPLENSIKDLYGLIDIIDEDVYGDSEVFVKNFCHTHTFRVSMPSWGKGRYAEIESITGFKNKPEFKRRFHSKSLGRTRNDVRVELPDLQVRNIILDLPDKQLKLYKKAEEGIFSSMKGFTKSVTFKERDSIALENAIRCQQFLGCPTKIREMIDNSKGSLSKNSKEYSKKRVNKLKKSTGDVVGFVSQDEGDEYVQEWGNQFDWLLKVLDLYNLETTVKLEEIKRLLLDEVAGQKVIIYSSFLTVIDYLEERLAGLKPDSQDKTSKPLKILRITGREDQEERNKNRKLFTESDDYNILLVTTAAVKALNLQAASIIICHDYPMTWGKLRQLVGRMVRIGSDHPMVSLICLIARDTVDQDMFDKLYHTQNDVEYIIGALDKDKIIQDQSSLDHTDFEK